MHSSKTWTTKDASIRTANAPRFTSSPSSTPSTSPTTPSRSSRTGIARVPLRRRNPPDSSKNTSRGAILTTQISPKLDLAFLDSDLDSGPDSTQDSAEPALHHPAPTAASSPTITSSNWRPTSLTASDGDTLDQYLTLYGQRDCAAAMHYAESHPERLPPPEDF